MSFEDESRFIIDNDNINLLYKECGLKCFEPYESQIEGSILILFIVNLLLKLPSIILNNRCTLP